MGKKKKKGNSMISSESKTCFTFAAGFLAVGIILFIIGKTVYHSDNMVKEEDIITGQTATVISVDKVDRNLSPSDKKREEDKGYTGDELRYEYDVTYQVTAEDGAEYTYSDKVRYHNDGSHKPEVGDTDVVNYAFKDGEFIIHPEIAGNNQLTFCGGFLIVLAVIAAALGLFLRK